MKANRVPPQNIDAEKQVLGAILIDGGCIDTVHGIITAEDFYAEKHRIIFSAMSGLADTREPIDLITLTDALQRGGMLEQVGGAAYIAHLIAEVYTSANVAHHCRLIAGASAARKLLTVAQEAVEKAYAGETDAALDLMESATHVQSQARKFNEPVLARDVLRDSFKEMERRSESRGKIQGISYGLHSLDAVTNGMHRGELIVVAGRPSMGKTTFALNILESVASSELHGLLFCLEMSRQNNMDKMLASRGKVRYQRIRSGNFEPADWDRMARASESVSRWPLRIDDTPGISFREIQTKAKRMKKTGLDVMVVDYLQLMSLPPKENRVQALGEISRGLKRLARELDIAVVLLSQLNRGVDSRPDKRPLMSDLRDSGEIEQDADVILFPFRPAAYCQQCKDRIDDGTHNYREHQAKAEIIIEKQRNGERNLSIPLIWFGEYQRFEDLDTFCK